MIGKEGDRDDPAPDSYYSRHVREVEKDVTDLKVTAGRHDERLGGIEKNMATQADLSRRWAEGLRLALVLIVPVLAAALGALAILLSGVLQTVGK